ncbi:MAG: 1-deoxy-D-xylulose-5-phosphate synthase [Lentisphaerae bacterium]|nr:1-deoxy-D-xylulose-5-phosphate synthase [Lentisphaerota bacterium]
MRLAWLRSAYYAVEEAVKGLFLDSVIFEEFGLRYIGPVDGHDINALRESLRIARDYAKPIIVHVATQKGRGYTFAEQQPEKWHGTSPFDVETGETGPVSGSPGYSQVFGRVLETLGERDKRIVAITAAMRSGTGLARFAERFPERFFDVGISEEHATVFAAGLATSGLLPVFAVYSTFSQRAVDCVIHDVCLQGLPVVLCLDRAGVVGDDGPTHHGVFDLALFRTIPGVTIMQPKDEAELAHMLYTATRLGAPAILRYPRGAGPGVAVPNEFVELTPGKAEVLRKGEEVQLWALGDMIPVAIDIAGLLEEDGVSAGVVNPRFVKPLDIGLLEEQRRACRVFVTLENGVACGGFGSAVEETLNELGFRGSVVRIGWPDEFVSHGTPQLLRVKHGMDAGSVRARITDALGQA